MVSLQHLLNYDYGFDSHIYSIIDGYGYSEGYSEGYSDSDADSYPGRDGDWNDSVFEEQSYEPRRSLLSETTLWAKFSNFDATFVKVDRNGVFAVQELALLALTDNDALNEKWATLRATREQVTSNRAQLRGRFQAAMTTRSSVLVTLDQLDIDVDMTDRVFTKFRQIRDDLDSTIDSVYLNVFHPKRQLEALVHQKSRLIDDITGLEAKMLTTDLELESMLSEYHNLLTSYEKAINESALYRIFP